MMGNHHVRFGKGFLVNDNQSFKTKEGNGYSTKLLIVGANLLFHTNNCSSYRY
jgi:hypothetical protein